MTGVVTSTELRIEALLAVAAEAVQAGATVHAVVPSPLPGSAGNREYFMVLSPRGGEVPGGDSRLVDGVRRAVSDDQPVMMTPWTRRLSWLIAKHGVAVC